MYEHDTFKKMALDYMYTALRSCGDRIIKGLDDIELNALVIEAEKKENQDALKDLGKGFMHLDELHKTIRKEVIPSLNWVDEIEVILAFEIQLRQKLSLPTQTETMLFRNCAKVTDERIEAIGDEILTSCEGQLDGYLKTWEPWKKHLRREEVKKVSYEALEEVEPLEDGDCMCAITHDTADKPVCIEGTKGVYDFEALKKHYIEKGTNPLTNKTFAWTDVMRCCLSKF